MCFLSAVFMFISGGEQQPYWDITVCPRRCADTHKAADVHVSFSGVNFTGLSHSSERTNQ